MKLSLPEAMFKRLEARWYAEGWEKGLQAIAGLVLFEFMAQSDQKRMIQLATRVIEETFSWTRVDARGESGFGRVVDDDQWTRMIEYLVKTEDGGLKGRRRASNG